ncbi:MAG: flagellar basal body L-ring protein FlgH [Pseudomonadaceae bacterium]|nr:flagellar basal body L-ring protein FlgH [Pseudomonadaceae bacterium]
MRNWKPRATLMFVLVTALLVSGCISAPPVRDDISSYRPTYPITQAAEPISDGSLFRSTRNVALYSDRTASQVGDIITVRLEEATTASKSAETTVSKSTGVDMAEPTVLGSLVRGVAANAGVATSLSSNNDFTGSGESDQSNSLRGTVSVVVAEVYPNGLLRVEGEKWLTLNQGEEFVRVSGLIRPDDVGFNNEVSSLQLADARIAYGGKGGLADSNRMGWLARFFLSPLLGF